MNLAKYREKTQEHRWELALFLSILAVGIFLRTFHFADWLHFEIDQAFDFDLVAPAVSGGIQNLPLLGPNVGGGLLRLGPAFYYLQYLGAVLFGNTPAGHAMTVLLLSIAAMPLFYLFCRRYFARAEALGLLAIFATSLYMVGYGRFSWSPNVLPFLMLLSFFALLQSVSPNEKHPARWFLAAVASVTVTSQIHFNSLFAAPLIAVAFVAIKRPRFPWKIWLAGLGIVFLFYTPVILNDVKNHKENYSYLKEKFAKTKPSDIFAGQTMAQTVQYSAAEFFFINTANDQINGVKLKGYGFECKTCRENLGWKVLALVLFFASFGLLGFKLYTEKNPERWNFLLLTLLWFGVSLALIFSIAQSYRMYPRFFLLISPLAIVLYGFVLQLLAPAKNKVRLGLFGFIVASLCFLNLQKIVPIFAQLQQASTVPDKAMALETGDIFPNSNRITLAQQIQIVDYIQAQSELNHFQVYLSSKSEYEPAFWALLDQRSIHYRDTIGEKTLFANANYFDIRASSASEKIDPKFSVLATAEFGILKVYMLTPKIEFLVGTSQPESTPKLTAEMQTVSQLLTWKKLFQ